MCSNPLTFVSPQALAVLFDAGLTMALFSSIVHEVLSHLNGDGKKGFSDTHSGRPNGIP